MKRSYLIVLAAMCAATGLVSMPAERETAKASTIVVSNPPDPGVPVARKAPDLELAVQKPGLVRLTGISMRPAGSGNGIEIEVSTSSPAEYRVLHLDHPNRLVLDLEGATNSTNRWRYPSDLPLLVRIRVGRFSREHGGVIRVVADLEGDPACHVVREATGFRIELAPKDLAAMRANPNPEFSANKPEKSMLQTRPAFQSKTLIQTNASSPAKAVPQVKPVFYPSGVSG